MTTIAESLVTDFEAEAQNTEKLLATVPDGRFDWKPHEKSMSLGQLAGHLAEIPTWLGVCLEDGMDFDAMADYQPFLPGTRREVLDAWARNRASFGPLLEGKDDAFLRGGWTMRKGDQVLMQSTRAQVVREILIHHACHHRGQLTVYLRLLGVPVPSTYGGTADDPMF